MTLGSVLPPFLPPGRACAGGVELKARVVDGRVLVSSDLGRALGEVRVRERKD